MPRAAKTNAVLDAQGRQRFHGAFTGGFSAGYFNTAGSETGFQPASFVSSRGQRAKLSTRQARDYMDEEDGILGGKLFMKQGVSSFGDPNALAQQTAQRTTSSAGLFEDRHLSQLMVQPADTMGKKLLMRMGWKPGQGIGARVRKGALSVAMLADTAAIPTQARDEEGVITFAPEDINLQLPPPKNDLCGLGFIKNGLLTKTQQQKNNIIRVSDLFAKDNGQRMEENYMDDDEDLAYDDAEAVDVNQPRLLNAFSTSSIVEDVTLDTDFSVAVCPSDGKPPLPGFICAQQSVEQIPYYPPPDVPESFQEQHVFTDELPKFHNTVTTSSTLGENSIFRLIAPEDQRRIQAIVKGLKEKEAVAVNTALETVVVEEPRAGDTTAQRPHLVPASILNTAFAGLAASFKQRFASASDTAKSVEAPTLPAGMFQASQLSELTQKLLPTGTASSSAPSTIEPTHEKKSLPYQLQRTTTAWTPAPLLCKRCNVKPPDQSKATPQSSANTVVKEFASLDRLFGVEKSLDTSTANAQEQEEGSREEVVQRSLEYDVYNQPVTEEARSLFKSVFESDDDDDEEEEGDDNDDAEVEDKADDAAALEAEVIRKMESSSTAIVAKQDKLASGEDKQTLSEMLPMLPPPPPDRSSGDGKVRFIPRKQRSAAHTVTKPMLAKTQANNSWQWANDDNDSDGEVDIDDILLPVHTQDQDKQSKPLDNVTQPRRKEMNSSGKRLLSVALLEEEEEEDDMIYAAKWRRLNATRQRGATSSAVADKAAAIPGPSIPESHGRVDAETVQNASESEHLESVGKKMGKDQESSADSSSEESARHEKKQKKHKKHKKRKRETKSKEKKIRKSEHN